MSKGKKFQEWDRMFSQSELTEERVKWLFTGTVEDRMGHTQWPHAVMSHAQRDIQIAVYELPSSVGWQRFRVSMKGCTTSEKLHMLLARRAFYDSAHPEHTIETIRIDNYLGALIRGGQLSNDGELAVIK